MNATDRTDAPITQGSTIDLTTVPEGERKRALDAAFHYRGDVTLTLLDGTVLECYLFDRREAGSLGDSTVRVMLSNGGEKRTIAYAQIRQLAFSGKDTAAGKSWESWIRRYVEKRLAGEQANIDSEVLD